MNIFPEFKNKKIVIWGLGTHGNGPAAVKFFSQNGAKILVTDLKTESDLKESLDEIKDIPNIEYVLGEHRESDFLNADIVFRSPAIPREVPLFQVIKDHKIEVQMAEGFFLKYSKTKNIIGVTGTKGKTTTSTLLTEIIRAQGLTVYQAGTPRNSAMDLVSKVNKDDWVVLEISSWDCEGLDENHVSPHVGIITNISHDHLNRYASYKDYAMSKVSIFKYQNLDDFFVTIKDGEFTKDFLEISKSKNILIDTNSQEYDFSGAHLKGEHNVRNMALCFEVAKVLGFDLQKTKEAILSFRGIPYRQEELGEINGVLFVNDSTATAPVAAISGIKTYLDKNPVVILGGADKKLDYSSLVNYVLETKVDYVLLKGSATDIYVNLGLDANKIYDDFEKAVCASFEIAKSKRGIVLLSPGTASFGMFVNEFDRGDKFNAIFEGLKSAN